MSEANKNIVQAVNNAFSANKPEDFLAHCREDIVWTIIGNKKKEGKTAIREWMTSMPDMEPPKFTVDKMIAEGNSVVCYGDLLMKDESGVEGKYSYCDAYEFDGDKIAELLTFIVKHRSEGDPDQA